MLQDYTLEVKLKELLGKELFGESFTLKMMPSFVDNKHPKQPGFKSQVNGFVDTLKVNSGKAEKQTYKKWDVYVVKFGMNTGSEVNGDRPAIVYKASHSTYGDDVVVIPLTSSGKATKGDSYDVYVSKDAENKLFQNSFARLRQIRAISTKRLGKKLGEIGSDVVKKVINDGIKKMLGVDG